MVYKSIRGISSNNLHVDYKRYNCRPDDYLLLEPKNIKTKFGKRTFEYTGPRLWNALPLKVRTVDKIDTFKNLVKTVLFNDTDGFKQRAFRYN